MEVEVCGGGTGKLKGNEGLVRDGMSGVKVGGKKVERWVSPGEEAPREWPTLSDSPGSTTDLYENLDKVLILPEPLALIYKRRINNIT